MEQIDDLFLFSRNSFRGLTILNDKTKTFSGKETRLHEVSLFYPKNSSE